MLRKAYLYMRFSSSEQAGGDSLNRQRALAREYIESRASQDIELVVGQEFIDEGVSSFAGQNLMPGRALHRFLEQVEDGSIAAGSVLLVESLDRLSRQQVIHAQRLLLDILLRGITVVTTSPTEAREYDGRSGLQDLIISLAGMERANQESALKSERVRRAWRRKKELAHVSKVTSRGPSWLSLSADKKSFVVLEEKAAVVRRIFELAESMGQGAIVKLLNAEKTPPLARGSSGWHESSVAKVLTNQAVIGVYQPHRLTKDDSGRRRTPDGHAIDGYYPPIVEKDAFYRVQALRQNRKSSGAGRKGTRFTNIFSGIARCSECQSPMAVVDKGRPPKGGKYFVCSRARRGAGCRYRAVKYELCESGFLLYCRRVDISDILPGSNSKKEETNLRKKLDAVLGEISKKQGLIKRLVASVEENGGAMPRSIHEQILQYEKRAEELELEKDEKSKELELVRGQAHQLSGMQTKFTELLIQLRASNDGEKYLLRSRLNAVLKASISSIDIGSAEPSLKSIIDALGRAAHVRMNEIHPEGEEKRQSVGLREKHSTRGEITCFRVSYKNGNTYELFLDSDESVAGRMTYGKSGKSNPVELGKEDGVVHLMLGFPSLWESRAAERDKSGRFARV